MNRLLARVLKIGLYSSLAVILLGWVLAAIQGGAVGEPRALPASELFPALARGNGIAILDLGLVMLMLTPVARVVAALIGFTRGGERRFALISLTVLLVLIASFTIASLTGVVAG